MKLIKPDCKILSSDKFGEDDFFVKIKFFLDKGTSFLFIQKLSLELGSGVIKENDNLVQETIEGKGLTFIIPTWTNWEEGEYIRLPFYDISCSKEQIWFKTLFNIEKFYFELINKGCSVELARSILPNSLKTEIIVTTNIETTAKVNFVFNNFYKNF